MAFTQSAVIRNVADGAAEGDPTDVTAPDDGQIGSLIGAARRLALALTGSVHEAEDLAQSTIAAVLAKQDHITGPVENYLRRAMVNQFRDHQRKTIRRRSPFPRLGPSTVFPDIAHRAADRLDLENALAALGDTARAVVVLRFLEDLGVDEVATLLGKPAGSIRRITHEALAVLRTQGLLRNDTTGGE